METTPYIGALVRHKMLGRTVYRVAETAPPSGVLVVYATGPENWMNARYPGGAPWFATTSNLEWAHNARVLLPPGA